MPAAAESHLYLESCSEKSLLERSFISEVTLHPHERHWLKHHFQTVLRDCMGRRRRHRFVRQVLSVYEASASSDPGRERFTFLREETVARICGCSERLVRQVVRDAERQGWMIPATLRRGYGDQCGWIFPEHCHPVGGVCHLELTPAEAVPRTAIDALMRGATPPAQETLPEPAQQTLPERPSSDPVQTQFQTTWNSVETNEVESDTCKAACGPQLYSFIAQSQYPNLGIHEEPEAEAEALSQKAIEIEKATAERTPWKVANTREEFMQQFKAVSAGKTFNAAASPDKRQHTTLPEKATAQQRLHEQGKWLLSPAGEKHLESLKPLPKTSHPRPTHPWIPPRPADFVQAHNRIRVLGLRDPGQVLDEFCSVTWIHALTVPNRHMRPLIAAACLWDSRGKPRDSEGVKNCMLDVKACAPKKYADGYPRAFNWVVGELDRKTHPLCLEVN